MLSEWWLVIATTLAKSTGMLCSRSSRICVVRKDAVRGLTFTRGQELGVSVYVDTDCAEKANGRRSVSRAAVMCGGVCVCWKSTTQRCVALSTTEAEYVAFGDRMKEALFMCAVVEFLLQHLQGKPMVVFEDNERAKALTENHLSSAPQMDR